MSTRSASVRAQLPHPVIDADGHLVEHLGVFEQFLRELDGSLPGRLDAYLADHPIAGGDAAWRHRRDAWWSITTRTRDRAAATAPALLAERMEEFGLDYTILYPSHGLAFLTLPDQELRTAACRALNNMNAELCLPYANRLTPAAAIPMHTPEEALDELEHAIGTLGLKVAAIPAGVARPIPAIDERAPDAFPAASWLDTYGVDSEHDYDPVWAAFRRHRAAVTCHGGAAFRYLPSGRSSPTNYAFNHVGGHAYQQQELSRSLFLSGVTCRFPDLPFGFLECGVSWAMQQLGDLAEIWEKRNRKAIHQYDPARVDQGELQSLLATYGGARFTAAPLAADPSQASNGDLPVDDFAALDFDDVAALEASFVSSFWFGCEADDRGVAAAFRPDLFGFRLDAMFASDIGHWDVPDISAVLAESHELVEEGVLTEQDFADLTCWNVARLHLAGNPDFFAGTAVESVASAPELTATGVPA